MQYRAMTSATALLPADRQRPFRGAQLHHQIVELLQHSWHEGVVAPPALTSISHQPRLSQHPEVKRETALRGTEVVLEIADTALTMSEDLQQGNPGLVGEGMSQPGEPGDIDPGPATAERSCDSHPGIISTLVDM